MEIDFAAKLVALLVGVFGLPKLWHEISERRRAKLTHQLSNSKELSSSVGSATGALVVQSAYTALTGRRAPHPKDIERLMQLEEPLKAFDAFHVGRDFLCRTSGRVMPFQFKERYRSPSLRRRTFIRLSILYFFLATISAVPLLFAKQIFSEIDVATLLGIIAWAFLFGWLAKISLDRLTGLMSARRLLKIRVAR